MRPPRTSHLPLRRGTAQFGRCQPAGTTKTHGSSPRQTVLLPTVRRPDPSGFYSRAACDDLSSDIVGCGSFHPTPFNPITGPCIAVAASAFTPSEEPGMVPPSPPGPTLTPPVVQASPPSPPASSDRQKSAMPEVIFAENLCKGCELCITVCPTKILKLDTSRVNIRGYNPAIVYNLAECSGCGSCAKICPDSVITVRR